MTTVADDASAILDPSVLNSFGNAPGNGDGVTTAFLPDYVGISTSAIPTSLHSDRKCCMWLLYLSFFLLSCVIMWVIITSLVVGFHVYRRCMTVSSWVQRCVKKQRKNKNTATSIRIDYHKPIQYDVGRVLLFKDVDEFGVDGHKRWFGSSMRDYILRRPLAPTCPKLEMGPKKSGSRVSASEEKILFDRCHPLWTYFSDEDGTLKNIESPDCNVEDGLGKGERTLTEQEWRNNFNCKLTMNNLVQPTAKTPFISENINSNHFLGSSID